MSLWRTARPRFALYVPDGLGRDRYIGYNNGGFWKNNEYSISRKPDYEYAKYNNFHTLFHMEAPFKYYSDGSGRDSYVFDCGLTRNHKPLASYKLTDFLRNNYNSNRKRKFGEKVYLSQGEKRFNKQKQFLERRMIKRLYSEPLEKIIEKKRIEDEKKKNKNNNNIDHPENEVLENDANDELKNSQNENNFNQNKHQYLRTSYNITKRYKLDAAPKKKVKVSKIEIEI